MKLIIWLKLSVIFFIYITNVFGDRKPSSGNELKIEPIQDCKTMNTNYMMDVTSKTGQHLCGGTLITSLNVLCAAHCNVKHVKLHAIDKEYRDYYYSKSSGLVQGAGRYLREVRNTYEHPEYDAKTSQNDIAILTLMSPIRDAVKPLNLPTTHLSSRELPLFCPVATVMAWGKDQLMCGQVITITLNECDEDFNELGDEVLCSKDNGICYNDSGGPLLCCGDNIQYGIVSQKMECEEGGPTSYTRVDLYLGFINRYKVMRSSQTLPIQSRTLMSLLLLSIFGIALF